MDLALAQQLPLPPLCFLIFSLTDLSLHRSPFQPSFDKQFARDWLTSHPGNDWTLPEDVVQKTIDKYLQSYKMLTGKDL